MEVVSIIMAQRGFIYSAGRKTDLPDGKTSFVQDRFTYTDRINLRKTNFPANTFARRDDTKVALGEGGVR